MSSERVTHEFPPVFDGRSRVLILGTIPSPRSRELGFYYMHPQNRFWKMLCAVLNEKLPSDIEGRKLLCLKHGIALWDVLESCDISGAEDSSIRNAVPNDLRLIIDGCQIRAVFTTGKKAHALYRRHFPGLMPDICLPSTSPANRTISEEKMLGEYMKISEYL
ncbi:MAG: DNA-deoxyinosine glycosylase [Lachnospiraceae bacterium]|nr:DNA-deoxyinosine glycosylase [Ruminococcus sp.]MCM1274405.1 DNA-deoxyinosine glycosylase [Lachnospiraceae bacterium]